MDEGDDGRLAAACAQVAREKGWPAEERRRLMDLLADEGRRRALFDHPRRMEAWGARWRRRSTGEVPGAAL